MDLPFTEQSFNRVFLAHFYGHLVPNERRVFLTGARRVAGELMIVDSALRPGAAAEQVIQERILNDGSRHRVFKRYLTAQQLADEIDGEVLLDGSWFVVARTRQIPG